MAHAGKFKKTEKYVYNIGFDGALQSTVRAGLMNDFIKYILYERQQIPLPYEQIKRDFKPPSRIDNTEPKQEGQHTVREKYGNRLEMKKAIKAITNLEQMFIEMLHVFEMCPEINKVLFVLGGTTISPKESYLINLQPMHPEADTLSLKTSTKQLFRQIIMNDMLGNTKSIPHTNLFVLVSAPRDCGITWFLPKPSYRISNRGKQFVFNFSSKRLSMCNQSWTEKDFEKDISGIEPLEASGLDMMGDNLKSISDLTDSMEETLQNDSLSSSSTVLQGMLNSREASMENSTDTPLKSFTDKSCFESEDSINLWYQAPITVKGYKDKACRLSIKQH